MSGRQSETQIEARTDALLDRLEELEPVSWNLGTPELAEDEAVQELVGMAPGIVPVLLEQMRGAASSRRVAYIANVLGRIGDVRALEPLVGLRARYEDRGAKDEWDHAVIGQANLAIRELGQSPR